MRMNVGVVGIAVLVWVMQGLTGRFGKWVIW